MSHSIEEIMFYYFISLKSLGINIYIITKIEKYC